MQLKNMANTAESGTALPVLYDRYLLLAILGLIAIGLLMVTSTSIVISNRLYGNSFHFLLKQLIQLSVGFGLALIVLSREIDTWKKFGTAFLVLSFIALVVVLIPGIGHQVNGSIRWVGYGPFRLQVSEWVKLFIIIYLASYLVRHEQNVRTKLSGFLNPLCVIGLVAVLLLKEPDFGAASVIMATALGMLFLAGVRLWHFLGLLALVLTAMATLAISSPYRMQRLTTFLNPWANQFDSGYQLTQSLIAFGRGGWSGVGLGESVQKLFYLPEAHTDFLFAVLGEELGLIGIVVVMILFAIVVARALIIGRRAQQLHLGFSAYMAYGIGLWIALQAMINIGVNVGVLPTKGLTLPLMSYGGSSLIVNCIALALLLRIDYECRCVSFGLNYSGSHLKHDFA